MTAVDGDPDDDPDGEANGETDTHERSWVVLSTDDDAAVAHGIYGDVETATEIARTLVGEASVQSVPDHRVDGADAVWIDRETARVAHRELYHSIQRTGGFEEGAEVACSPLARVRQLVEDLRHVDEHTRREVLQIIIAVAEERDVEWRDADPLTGAVFEAESELAQAATATDGGGVETTGDTDPRGVLDIVFEACDTYNTTDTPGGMSFSGVCGFHTFFRHDERLAFALQTALHAAADDLFDEIIPHPEDIEDEHGAVTPDTAVDMLERNWASEFDVPLESRFCIRLCQDFQSRLQRYEQKIDRGTDPHVHPPETGGDLDE